jgi:hypothetical protein
VNLDGWPEWRGWVPDDATNIDLERLADVARQEIGEAIGTLPWPEHVHDAIRAINLRLQEAGLPEGLADAAATAWLMMRDHWSVEYCVTRMIEPQPENRYPR